VSDFVSILEPAAPLDPAEVKRLARHGCLNIHRVRWPRSYLASDGRRMLCWYQARDAESVRLVLRQQGAATAVVWSAAVEGRPADEAGDAATGRIVAEWSLPTADVDSARRVAGTIAETLRAAGQQMLQMFLDTHRSQGVCVIEGDDAALVTACLSRAGVMPTRVWRADEVDPRPARLFGLDVQAAATAPAKSVAPVDSARESHALASAPDAVDAVIIGAGIAGICALERFLRMGLRVRVYESGADVGGVWFWNRYPGARVDSEVYTYAFSFSDALVDDWAWQEVFAAQPELARYLQHVVDRFDLRRHMRFNARVTQAVYDARQRVWRVATETGEAVTARFLVAATGSLTEPQLPDYPGIDRFAGEHYHTARWPAAKVDLAGKCVGIIGTGATGVQVIQTIASTVAELTVFQRTPNYCIPQRNRRLTDDDRERIRREWKDILGACRASYGGFIHTFDSRSGLAVSEAEREAKFEALWGIPGFAFWFANFADLMMNDDVNAFASEFVRRKIRARVKDPQIAAKLLPDHPFGTKRVPLEDGYFETFNRANVRLVDLRQTPIERVTARGIRTSDHEYPLDVVIYATGFDAGTGALTRIDIRGESGVSLRDKRRDGASTFLGLLVAGFPNLFMVNGPHNAAALCNAGRCIEQNVDWIARCLTVMRERGSTRVEPSAAAETAWTEHVHDVADGTVLGRHKESWFFGANTPGKPRRVTIYAGGARTHREHCEAVAAAEYAGLSMS